VVQQERGAAVKRLEEEVVALTKALRETRDQLVSAQIEVDNLEGELADAHHNANELHEDLRDMDLMVFAIRHGDPVSRVAWRRHLRRTLRDMGMADFMRPIVVQIDEFEEPQSSS
jgi:septal ring factor EnvC (AmiA/AmiB activator)